MATTARIQGMRLVASSANSPLAGTHDADAHGVDFGLLRVAKTAPRKGPAWRVATFMGA